MIEGLTSSITNNAFFKGGFLLVLLGRSMDKIQEHLLKYNQIEAIDNIGELSNLIPVK